MQQWIFSKLPHDLTLSKAAIAKPILTTTDMRFVLEALWQQNSMSQWRSVIQTALITQILAYTVGRPGSILASNSYSDEATRYRDFKLFLLGNEASDIIIEFSNWLYEGKRLISKTP